MAWKPEPAGSMRRRISILRPVGNRDGRGGKKPEYAVALRLWAKAKPIGPSDFLKTLGGAAMQQWAERAMEFTVRYVPGNVIEHDCMIEMNGRKFNVVGVVDREERHINLVITASEVL